MKNKRQIAERITDRLFSLMQWADQRPRRIQFMVGIQANGTEQGAGGLNEAAFRDWLFHELNSLPEHLEGE